eukprot:gene57687-biopygen116069
MRVPTGRTGAYKWQGAAAVGATVFFAPYNSDDMLVLDSCTGDVSFVPTGATGDAKWLGAAAVGAGVYFVPHDQHDILALRSVPRT